MDLKNTFASTLSNTVKHHNFNAEIRGFKNSREAALFSNHIPESVYDALVEAINQRLNLLHKYVDLRQKVLKLDDVRMYDLYVPMVEDVEFKFTYQEAQEIILEALSVLGDDYVTILKKAFSERWIDVLENDGKRSGAYSSGCYTTNPFILLNWQDNLDNVYTLAHELGHSLHSYYSRLNQDFIYGDYSIFVAEVASTTNENLLTAYLLKKYTDPKIQAYIINHFLDGVKGTVYRQTQFAEFEHFIHTSLQDGVALTTDFLSENYDRINRKYYGETMVYDEEIKYEWARIPHFYYNYYVYQYATGFSAASALSYKIINEGEPAVKNYLKFLASGSSVTPINALLIAGVDMRTNQATLDALKLFEIRLDELEKLLLK
jgi:oligoendopeptidase F